MCLHICKYYLHLCKSSTMSMFSKQQGYLSNVCDIKISFTGMLYPSNVEDYQPFYNSLGIDLNFIKLYFSSASVAFLETSQDSKAGPSYKQKLTLFFPERFDGKRSERIAALQKVKFVQVTFTNGKTLLVGRNDFIQNQKPLISVQSDLKYTQVQFESESITPSGYAMIEEFVGLPSLFPVSFI
jgi:hypothetical protein